MKKILAIIMSVLVVLSMAACQKNNETVVPEVEKETIEETVQPVSKQKVPITVFNVVENKNEKKEIELENPSPKNIAIAIMEQLGYKDVKVNSATDSNNKIYIDFKSDSEFLKGGTAGETAVLDSLALTFIEDLKYEHIYYTIDRKPYESGHIALGKDEPYM